MIYRTVKAEDRNPDKNGMYICILKIIEDGVTYRPVEYCRYWVKQNKWVVVPGEVIEWLEEVEPIEEVSGIAMEEGKSAEEILLDEIDLENQIQEIFDNHLFVGAENEVYGRREAKKDLVTLINPFQSRIAELEEIIVPHLIDEIKIKDKEKSDLETQLSDKEKQITELKKLVDHMVENQD